ncbi:MAG: hypothetical protein M1830_006963 [Pleopsidium flavum]|nr:MAG: hypothetical protein M1830_006963 [Pleopsidium flavum]
MELIRSGLRLLSKSSKQPPQAWVGRSTSQRCIHQRATPQFSTVSHHRPSPLSRSLPSAVIRYSTTASAPTNHRRSPSQTPPTRAEQEPAYELTFTCKPCRTRSAHRVSKQGYHKGTVLITCPDCKNRHVISDHLKIFSDTSMTIEDLMRDKGELVKKGTLGTEGDVEFWEDGSTSERRKDEINDDIL